MPNATMVKFGFPSTLVRDYEHWVVLLRPAQVTLGSLILAAKSDAIAFGQLPPGAHAELAVITKDIEATLLAEIGYEKINYLMLMMVDPHVHFHVFPRYEGCRTVGNVRLNDAGWPGQPDLGGSTTLPDDEFAALQSRISRNWLTVR
ncbi:MAG TPA: HIT family protein [Sphingomicrobium sp.]|nr:HIT family protein [Sphingomicrobium sp.]